MSMEERIATLESEMKGIDGVVKELKAGLKDVEIARVCADAKIIEIANKTSNIEAILIDIKGRRLRTVDLVIIGITLLFAGATAFASLQTAALTKELQHQTKTTQAVP